MAVHRNLQTVKRRLFQFVETSDSKKDKIAVFASYPLVRDGKTGKICHATAPTHPGSFGYFTPVTGDLAASIVWHGAFLGKQVDIALLVDDHSRVEPDWFQFKNLERVHPLFAEIIKNVRDVQEKFELPRFLTDHFITERNMVISRRSKKPVFWESDYRRTEGPNRWDARLGCTDEMKWILQELSEQGYTKVIGFFPLKCQGAVFQALTDSNMLQKKEGTRAQERLIVTLDTEIERDQIMDMTRKIGELRELRALEGVYPNHARFGVGDLFSPKRRIEEKALEFGTLMKKGKILLHRE